MSLSEMEYDAGAFHKAHSGECDNSQGIPRASKRQRTRCDTQLPDTDGSHFIDIFEHVLWRCCCCSDLVYPKGTIKQVKVFNFMVRTLSDFQCSN